MKDHRSKYCRQDGECKYYSLCIEAIGDDLNTMNDAIWPCELGFKCYRKPERKVRVFKAIDFTGYIHELPEDIRLEEQTDEEDDDESTSFPILC